MFTVRIHALRVLKLRNKFPAIMDAIDPGGSGDPYAGLNAEERPNRLVLASVPTGDLTGIDLVVKTGA